MTKLMEMGRNSSASLTLPVLVLLEDSYKL
jgi:hypothetical protein